MNSSGTTYLLPMTRINADIPVKLLSDHHLRAEQKEIARLPLLFKSRHEKGIVHTEIPYNFTLGTGHLLFFMDKGQWVYNRWSDLTDECKRRKIEPRRTLTQKNIDHWIAYESHSTIKYRWSNPDRILVINRIIEKMLPKMRDRENYGVAFMGEKEPVEITIQRLMQSIN